MATASSSTIPGHITSGIAALMNSLSQIRPTFPPFENMPCANARPSAPPRDVCKKEGTSVCGACRLVAYCSKNCQTAHWKDHKKDCKHELRSADWKPGWVRRSCMPIFVNDKEETMDDLLVSARGGPGEMLGHGVTLWGNTPAVDLLNIAANEKDDRRDYSIAIAASGDLRNVVKTVNSLPEDYSGHLTIVLNDHNPIVVARNVMLLLTLGNHAGITLAADVALHLWYSVFMPWDYRSKVSSVLIPWMVHARQAISTNEDLPFRIGEKSELNVQAFPEQYSPMAAVFERWSATSQFPLEEAQAEYQRVRDAPTRQDYRDKMYYNLRKSHRVAFRKYRDFGIILPHGAVNAHFNVANPSLFSLEGKWLQPDYADPIEGWSVSEILEAGKRHGGTSEDIYGCFYFLLSEQLREFAKRVRRFRISFKLFPFSSYALAKSIREGLWEQSSGLPSTVPFDRIVVSNILDENYEGMESVLTEWAPLLSRRNPHASIVGYLMNWFLIQRDGQAHGAGKGAVDKAMAKNRKALPLGLPNIADPVAMMTQLYCSFDNMDAFYDNSTPFAKYLRKQGINTLLRQLKLKLKERHTVFPHRLCVPLGAPSNATPNFANEDDCYHQLELFCRTWSERFVEFAPN